MKTGVWNESKFVYKMSTTFSVSENNTPRAKVFNRNRSIALGQLPEAGLPILADFHPV